MVKMLHRKPLELYRSSLEPLFLIKFVKTLKMKYRKIVKALDSMIYFIGKQGITYQGSTQL